MRAENAKAVAEFLLGDLEREVATTTAVFAAVPSDHLNYQRDARAKTALGLLRHVTLEDEWFLNSIAEGQFEQFPDDSDACGVMTPQDAATRYKERMPAAIARVRALSGEELLKELDFSGAFRMPALNFLSMVLRHSVHHRGQLSTYIRPMGGKVPSIYGPSADVQTMGV